MKITIYKAQEIELTEPKCFLIAEITKWAIMLLPDTDQIRTTDNRNPFGTSSIGVYKNEIGESTEISEARFYEIVATNYATHLNNLQKMAQEWGLEMHTLKDYPTHAEEMAWEARMEECRERAEEKSDYPPSNWEL